MSPHNLSHTHLIASLVFPVWLVTFLVDEVPVGLSAALLLAELLAARRALQAPSSGASAAWAAAAGLALFLGLWTKLVFAWWLPAVAVFVLAEARRQGFTLAAAARRRIPALLAGAAFLAVPTTLLLASVDRDGRPYAAALRQGGLSTQPQDVEAVALRLVQYVTDASLVAPRNLLLPRSGLDDGTDRRRPGSVPGERRAWRGSLEAHVLLGFRRGGKLHDRVLRQGRTRRS